MHVYKQNETLGVVYFQIPIGLFAGQKYKELSITAKVAYGLLLYRMQLSSMKGWVNQNGEVYIIYTREQLAAQLGISYKSAIRVFQELKSYGLILEQKRGRGLANHIYICKAELNAKESRDYTDTWNKAEQEETRHEEITGLDSAETEEIQNTQASEDRPVKSTGQENAAVSMPETNTEPEVPIQSEPIPERDSLSPICKNDRSKCVKSSGQELSFLHPSKQEISQQKKSYHDVKPSVSQDDEKYLQNLLDSLDYDGYTTEEAAVLRSSVERLYYSKSVTVGNAVLPQPAIRRLLQKLNTEILQTAYHKLRSNARKVKNCIAYIMSVILNTIVEFEGEFMVDPYLNSFYSPLKGARYAET